MILLKPWSRWLLFVCFCLGSSIAQQRSETDALRVYVIPFSHLDLFWACTQEECLSRGNYLISKAIQLALQDPQYRYLLESDVFVANFVESHRGTKELEDFKRLVKEGHIEISPLWASIFQNQTRGEALIRNLLYGKLYALDTFGVKPSVAHLADIPGFTRQYPQMLSKSEVPYMVMTRMGPRDRSLFHWQSPDGSSVLVWNTIKGYGWGVGLGLHLEMNDDQVNAVRAEVSEVGKTSAGPIYLGWGTDLYAPNDQLTQNIAILNRRLSPITFRLATAEEFFRAAAPTPSMPTLTGEIPSSWANLTTSLVPLWPPAMSATDTLITAEKFASVNYALGYAPYPTEVFDTLWKSNLKALDHNNDGQGGKIGDERKLGYAQEAQLGASQILRDSLRNIAERVGNPFPKSTPIVVFNPLAWTRDDHVEAHITLFGDVATNDISDYEKGMRLVDEKGTSIPFQVEQYSNGSSRSLDLAFTARDVPSLGYATYFLLPAASNERFSNAGTMVLNSSGTSDLAAITLSSASLENQYYRVTVDRGTGRVDVFDKELNRLVGKGLEIVGNEERGGDDQNVILATGRTIAKTIDKVAVEEDSPARAVLRITGMLADIPIDQRLTLYRDLKKVDIEDTIHWTPGRSINLEQVFPLEQPDVEVRNGIPFGTASVTDFMAGAGPFREDEVALEIWKGWRQIQDWICAGDKDWSFTVSADHQLFEVDHAAIKGDMLRGTIFSPTLTYKEDKPIADLRPPAGTYVFRYSLTSGRGDWVKTKSWKTGMAFSTPLIAVSAVNPIGEKLLVPKQAFLSLQSDDAVLTAMKKSETDDSIVIRTFEIEGKSAETPLLFLGSERRFHATNLLEESLTTESQKSLHFSPYEISTVKLKASELSPANEKR